jgi:hypothetical protein
MLMVNTYDCHSCAGMFELNMKQAPLRSGLILTGFYAYTVEISFLHELNRELSCTPLTLENLKYPLIISCGRIELPKTVP